MERLRNNSWIEALGRHPLLTGVGLSMVGIVLSILFLLGLEVYVRAQTDRLGTVWNWQGYRGPVVERKVPWEVRIAVLGGSTAFGYGVPNEHSFPTDLEQRLNERVSDVAGWARKVKVLNLAYPGESAVCFANTLDSYAYLQPDIVLIYSGINDTPSTAYYRKTKDCFRNKSIAFRVTRYIPIRFLPALPLVAREKYYQLRYGTIDEGYRRLRARALQRAKAKSPTTLTEKELKDKGYKRYEHYITSLIDEVLAQGKAALFVTQPYFDKRSYREWQQGRLRGTLERKYGGVSRFRYVTLGELFNRQPDPEITYNRMHLTPRGNKKVAQALVEPSLDLIGSLPSR